MREDRALGLLDWRRAEFHAAALSARSGFLRSEATISPMIDTAISAGLTAPMSSPIGAWMRASAASSKPSRAHPLDPLGVRLSRSERADVETIGLERDHERRVVDLGVMGQEADRGIAVERRLGERFVRPLGDDGRVGKALRRREGGARIDDRYVETGDSRDRRQRLRDMHGADEGQARRRRLNGQKIVLALVRDRRAFAHAQRRFQFRGERIGVDDFGANESLLAVGKAGDDGAGAPFAASQVHRLEDVETHQASFST